VHAVKRYEGAGELLNFAELQTGMDIFIEEGVGGPGAWGRCEATNVRGEFRIQFANQCALWQESVRNAGFAFGWESDNWYDFNNFHVFRYLSE